MASKIQAALNDPQAKASALVTLVQECDRLIATKESAEMTNTGAKALKDGVMRIGTPPKSEQGAQENSKANMQDTPRNSPPEAPVELQARSNGCDAITLAWVPPSSAAAIEHYEIRQHEEGEWHLIHKCDHNSITYTLKGLAASTRYCFGVRGVSKYGPGPWKSCTATTAAPMYYSPLPGELKPGSNSSFGREGLIYWIGTQEGTSTDWRNPAITGDIVVNVSSKDAGNTNNALARAPAKLCTKNDANSWITLKFAKYSITIHGYALRLSRPCGDMVEGVCYAPRSWLLEASNDGINWELIHDHRDDRSLSLETPVALWKVTSTDIGFNQIRIRMTGQNARGTEGGRNRLAIAGIELYGIVMVK